MKNMIEFRNVSYGYNGVALLKDVSFNIPEGSFTAVAGENGAGKSTICRLSAALLRPVKGEVISNGLCTSREKTALFAKFTGFLFQNPDRQICRSTVREEIAFGLESLDFSAAERDAATDGIMEEFGFDPEQEIFSMGRGERQMLALASVLVRRPKLLIADEPTSGLDAVQYRTAAEKLREANKNGATVMMVTHDMELAEELADEMIAAAGGEIKAHASVEDIFSDSAVMERASLCRPEMRELACMLGDGFAKARSADEITEIVKAAKRSEA